MTIQIRQVKLADITPCFKLEQICFPPEEAAPLSSIKTRIEQYPQGFLVLTKNKQIIGHINSGSTHKDDITDESFKALIGHDPNGKNNVIFSMAIHPDHRRQNHASKLLQAYITHIKTQKNTQNILLICKDELIPFYEKNNFKYNQPSTSTHGGATWHEMIYAL